MNLVARHFATMMDPTAELYESSANPFHRAIIRTWWRHIHLEGAAMLEEITAPDMMVEHPRYRVSWGTNQVVVEGIEGVKDFYGAVGDTLLWHSDDSIAVADWGMADEITFHQVATGRTLAATGYETDDPNRFYHVTSRQAFIWHFDEHARLIGEHLYEDATSLSIEPIDEEEIITPEQSRAWHRAQLGKLAERFGERYWDYRYVRDHRHDL